jgi:hypothetical protein
MNLKNIIKNKLWISISIVLVLITVVLTTLILPEGIRVNTDTGTISLSINKVQADTQKIKQIYPNGWYGESDSAIQKDGTVKNAPYNLTIDLTGEPRFSITDKGELKYDVFLKGAGTTKTSLSITPNKKPPIVKDNTVTWQDYYPDIDVIVSAGIDTVYMYRIIKSSSAATFFDVEFVQSGIGTLTILPIPPAVDASGQKLKMLTTATDKGRIEELTSDILTDRLNPTKIAQPITYPVIDALAFTSSTILSGSTYDKDSGSVNTTIPSGADLCLIHCSTWRDPYTQFPCTTLTLDGQSAVNLQYSQYSNYEAGSLDYVKGFATGSSKTFAWNFGGSGDPGDGAAFILSYFAGTDTSGPIRDSQKSSVNTGSQATCTTAAISSSATDLIFGSATGYGATIDMAGTRYTGQTQQVTPGHSTGGAEYDCATKAGASPTATISAYTAAGLTFGCSIKAATGGTPSITNTPSSKSMGTLLSSSTFWSKNGSSAPSFPLTAGNCTFIVTNNGTITVNVSANATNPTGGSGATLVMGSPGSDQIRVSLYKAGDGTSDNLTLTTTQHTWLSSLAASANVSWDMKLEIGTSSESPPTAKTFHIYLVASAS